MTQNDKNTNVREAYTNFMMSSIDTTLFNVLFVLAASGQIRVEVPNKLHTLFNTLITN